jgi:hypothetical protein
MVATATNECGLEQQEACHSYSAWRRLMKEETHLEGGQGRERELQWQRNRLRVLAHNQRAEQHGYRLALNRFADLSLEEFIRGYTGIKLPATATTALPTFSSPPPTPNPLPAEQMTHINWLISGVVPEVTDQGNCGSCWAFSSANVLSAHLALWQHQRAPLLSPQELVDCVPESYSCGGCDGGIPSRAMEYALTQLGGGLEPWSAWPYQARDQPCRPLNQSAIRAIAPANRQAQVFNITPGDQRQLLYSLSTNGPISIAIDVTENFQLYHSGVFNDPSCSRSEDSLNHAVTLYGLTQDPLTQKWVYMVRNSWGVSGPDQEGWGLGGDIFMDALAQDGNLCGVSTMAATVVLI